MLLFDTVSLGAHLNSVFFVILVSAHPLGISALVPLASVVLAHQLDQASIVLLPGVAFWCWFLALYSGVGFTAGRCLHTVFAKARSHSCSVDFS